MKLITVLLVILLAAFAAFADIINVDTPVDEYYWKGDIQKTAPAKKPEKQRQPTEAKIGVQKQETTARIEKKEAVQRMDAPEPDTVVCEAESQTC